MGPIKALKTCMAKYGTFHGRASRLEFWWFALAATLVWGAYVAAVGLREQDVEKAAAWLRPLVAAPGLAMLPPLVAAAWRRMHDAGRPGGDLFLAAVVTYSGAHHWLEGRGLLGHPFLVAERTLLAAAGLALAAWWLSRPSRRATSGDDRDGEFGGAADFASLTWGMAPIRAVGRGLRGYASFSGRAGTAEFWWFALAVAAVWLAAIHVFSSSVFPEAPLSLLWLLRVSAIYALLPAVVSAGWRRMHDVGRPGWHAIIPVMILLGGVALDQAMAPAMVALGLAEGGKDSLAFKVSSIMAIVVVLAFLVTVVLTIARLMYASVPRGARRADP